MQRIKYWIKRIISGNNRYCTGWCITCPYFKQCRRDGFEKKELKK